jgi:predicted RNA-binding Zn ribbon-like protein
LWGDWAVELASYGNLAVALVNTDEPGRRAGDHLVDLDDLRGLLGEHAKWRTDLTLDDVARLRELRPRVREVFELAAEADHAGAVERLNLLLDEAVIRPQISGHDGQAWHLHISEGSASVATAYTAAAIMGLAVQLTEVGVERFGVCQSPPCRNVFVDTSTNRSRRYCSDRCATRANVAAYRARRRAAS